MTALSTGVAAAGAAAAAVSPATLYALCGAALIGIGLYGFIVQRPLLRRLVAFNVIGSGIFLLFGATGWRQPHLGADPVPQALIITGIVVALSATALMAALIVRLAALDGRDTLPEDGADSASGTAGGDRPAVQGRADGASRPDRGTHRAGPATRWSR
jgi:multicomponent Na+:H+ antiporter subunit C